MDRFAGLGWFSKTGLRIRLLLWSGFKRGEFELIFVNLVHLVANIWGDRFGEDEVTRSEETIASVLEEKDVLFGPVPIGPQEKVADFLGTEEMLNLIILSTLKLGWKIQF